uniref:Uncharacterized protein n=1 Tax=Aureoumbra lagunensis TaxID=44058 RepID=A0A7S3NIN2_9STRA
MHRKGRFVFSENKDVPVITKKKSLLDSDIRGSVRAQQAMALAAQRKKDEDNNVQKVKKKTKRSRMDDAIAARLLAPKVSKNPELKQKQEIEERRAAIAKAVHNSSSMLLPKRTIISDLTPKNWRDERGDAEKRISRPPVAQAFYGNDDNIKDDNINDVKNLFDYSLECRLRPHQIDGAHFIYERLKDGAGGAMICDAMGLGKTATTLAALGILMGIQGVARHTKKVSPRCVIACPAGVANTWLTEAARWWPMSSVRIFAEVGQGKLDNRIAKRRKRLDYVAKTTAKLYTSLDEEDDAVARFSRCSLAAKPVLVISYESYRSRADRINALFDIGFLVCDEAHRLKGGESTEAFTALDACPARRRILVTATPVQNGLTELHNLLQFCDAQFMASQEQHCVEDIRKALRILAIRRRVGDAPTLELPRKTETILSCRPTQMQLDALRALIPNTQESTQKNKASALRALNAACLTCSSLGKNDLEDCGKWHLVLPLLRHLRQTTKERVLLISRFSAVLDTAIQLAQREGWPAARIDGSTELDTRYQIQNDLNAIESNLFLVVVSLRAGGVGLTLTGASRLILFEPSWNPSEDDQAVARIWRFGQVRSVFIYRLLTALTIEEHVIQRQRQKRTLAAGIRSHISSSALIQGNALDEVFDEYNTTAALPPVTSLSIQTLLTCPENISKEHTKSLNIKLLQSRDPFVASIPCLFAENRILDFSFFSDDDDSA